MRKVVILILCTQLSFSGPAAAFSTYGEDNPFVEAMLRMMEIFGLINRGGVPFGTAAMPGMSGLSTLGMLGYPGMAGFPGMSPWSGMGGIPGASGWPGGLPNYGQWTGAWTNPSQFAPNVEASASGYLDGLWELTNGSWVVIKRNRARLYLNNDRYQDFTIGYNQRYFWWTPLRGNTTTHYQYQMRDGRMILRDNEGNALLMRRQN